jgi:outer membrane protein TolC
MLTSVATLLSLAAGAEETAVRLSLGEAIERAQRSSARLAQLRSLETAAAAGVRVARAGRFPLIDVGASYTRNSDVPELTLAVPGAGTRTLFPNIPDNLRARAGLSFPLYTGGRVGSAISAAESQRTAAENDVTGGTADLVLEVSTAYWSLVTARESARVLSEAVTSFEAHLGDARNRQEQGMVARNELLAVQVERDRAELSRLQPASAAEVANANLLRLLDLPGATRVEPVEPLAAPATPAVETETLVAAAFEHRPELMAVRARARAAEAAVRVARAASLPQAGLTAGYDYARPNTRVLPLVAEWQGTWSVSASVAWTVFDGRRTSAAAAEAEARAQALRDQLKDLEGRLRLEVTTRALELGTAQAAVVVAERNLEAAKENLRVSQDRYREGVIASSDLLDAETALLRAGLDRTAAVTQVHMARASLARASGVK